MGYLLIGAYGAGELIVLFKKEWLRYLFGGVLIIGCLVFVDMHSEYLESWFN
jgi:cytochrome c biogenesis protein CcdA